MKGSINLQDLFLNKLKKEKIDVTIYLINGYHIKGYIKGFDNYIILIENDEKQHMIYKHAISTLIPSRQIKPILKHIEHEKNQ